METKRGAMSLSERYAFVRYLIEFVMSRKVVEPGGPPKLEIILCSAQRMDPDTQIPDSDSPPAFPEEIAQLIETHSLTELKITQVVHETAFVHFCKQRTWNRHICHSGPLPMTEQRRSCALKDRL